MGEALEVCELGDLAGERVEQADIVVPVTLQEEQAVGGVEDAVVLELREGDADDGPGGGEVEEAGMVAERAVAREPAEALEEEHPTTRVEAQVQQGAAARGGSCGGGAPMGADRGGMRGWERSCAHAVGGYGAVCGGQKSRQTRESPGRARKGRRKGKRRRWNTRRRRAQTGKPERGLERGAGRKKRQIEILHLY